MTRRTLTRATAAALGLAAAGLVAPAAAQAAPKPVPVEPLAAPTAFVVVQHGQGVDKAVAAVKASGGTVVQEWPQIGVVIAGANDGAFDDRARRMPGIDEAGPARAMQAYADPKGSFPVAPAPVLGPGTTGGDDLLEERGADQWDMRLIHADQAHKITDGNRAIAVGVLDSGVQADHPDLAANVDASLSVGCTDKGIPNRSLAAWQATTSAHGTHVAGTIAAARNGKGIVGVAPNVRIAAIKVVDNDGFIYPEYAICGFMTAAEEGLKVTNNSYFIDPYYLWCRANKDERAVIEAVERALEYSEKKDVVNVAASGNSNWDLSKPITDTGSPNNLPDGQTPVPRTTDRKCYDMPSQAGNTIAVASVGPDGVKSYFSNYGRRVIGVAAPGGNRRVPADTPSKDGRILSTVPGGTWGWMQGTSMASPHVAGVVALLRGAHTELDAKRAINRLTTQAESIPCPATPPDENGDGVPDAVCEGRTNDNGFYGAGLVDALRAVR